MACLEQRLEEGILTITFDRPEKLNALSMDVLQLLSDYLRDAKDNTGIKGVMITGKGKAFCAGVDITQLAGCNAQTGYEFACFGQSIFRQLETLGKPSLAAINGFAFGGGCELAMAATFRIATNQAQFGQPEVKLGVIPGYGGTQRLARLVGKGRALDLCLTGRFIDAETALQWGLVNEVVDADTLLQAGQNRLESVIALAPLAVASIMEVIDRGYNMSLSDALHLEAIHFGNVCDSQDKNEGVAAFLAKRQAQFKGV